MRIDQRALIIIVITLMPFGCSSKIEIKESPAKPVAREFLQAVSQSDIDAAWNMVNPAQKKCLPLKDLKLLVSDF